MLKKGARYIAIASRSGAQGEVADQIRVWNKEGHHVMAIQADVGNYEQCRSMFESFDNPETGFPPLRGIIHSGKF